MLLTKTITETKEIQVELKTPAFYTKKDSKRHIMLCQDGAIISSWYETLTKHVADNSYSYKSLLSEVLTYEEAAESDFWNSYHSALSSFEKSMFPNDLPRIQSTVVPVERLELKDWHKHIDQSIQAAAKPDTADFDRRVNQLSNNMNPIL